MPERAFHLFGGGWPESFWGLMKYADLLKMPEWRDRRSDYVGRLSEKPSWPGCEYCENCYEILGSHHLHHRRYISGRLPWEYEDTDLMLLCEVCHKHVHDVAKFAQEFILASMPHVANEFEMFLTALMDSECPKNALARAKNAVLECSVRIGA